MAKLVNAYNKLLEWLFPTHCVVDMDDKFVLYAGRFEECELALEQSYGGNLFIIKLDDLPDDIDRF